MSCSLQEHLSLNFFLFFIMEEVFLELKLKRSQTELEMLKIVMIGFHYLKKIKKTFKNVSKIKPQLESKDLALRIGRRKWLVSTFSGRRHLFAIVMMRILHLMIWILFILIPLQQ